MFMFMSFSFFRFIHFIRFIRFIGNFHCRYLHHRAGSFNSHITHVTLMHPIQLPNRFLRAGMVQFGKVNF